MFVLMRDMLHILSRTVLIDEDNPLLIGQRGNQPMQHVCSALKHYIIDTCCILQEKAGIPFSFTLLSSQEKGQMEAGWFKVTIL